MQHTLYCKNDPILSMEIEDDVVVKFNKIEIPEKLPLFLQKELTLESFNTWIKKRKIPETREGLRDTRLLFGTAWEKNKNLACLSDQFWIRTSNNESWGKINFFTNVYSNDIGNMFFQPWMVNKKKINNFSPDLMTNGVLQKRWIQNLDKTSSLLKAGSVVMHQEPLSEVLASVVMERLNIIPFVRYDLHIEGMTMCSKCDNFITSDTEFIPAYYIYLFEKRDPSVSVYDHLIKMCDKFEIVGAKEFIDNMIFIDNITGNEDRHLGNFGFIKNVNTNKIIGPAPLFDSGTAYWSTKAVKDNMKSKLFHDVEERISTEAKGKYDMHVLLGDYGYEEMILNYPNLSNTKKENMINAIGKKNRELNRISTQKRAHNILSR